MSPTLVHRADRQAALLAEWVRTRQRIARLEARALELLAGRLELMDEDVAEFPLHRDAIWRSMVAEFSATGRLARGGVEIAFTDAHALMDFPVLRDSFSAGTVSVAHVQEILRASGVVVQAVTDGTVEPGVLRLYEAGALEFAENETPARTRAHVRELAAALAGSTAIKRHEDARAEREVTVRTLGEGLALLQAVLPEHLAVAILDRLTQLARHQQRHPGDRPPTLPDDVTEEHRHEQTIFGSGGTFTRDPFENDDEEYWAHVERMITDGPQVVQVPPDSRTLDQIRADVLSDPLLSAAPSEVQGAGLESIRGTVQVTVAATTLAGLDDRPAQLDGHGVLHPDVPEPHR